MANKADYVSYVVAVIYVSILLGCLVGIRKNWLKKRSLVATNEYEKQQRVIRWRYRFYLTLFSAILIRIVTLISAVILGKTMVLSKSSTQNEFIWSSIASVASMLFFTSFTFIIWFFASVTFHQQLKYKRLITPFFTALNVALYMSALSIAISSSAAAKWDLVYDYELPLFAICAWVLAVCFIFLSYKISNNIQRERQDNMDYIEHSRKLSVTQSQQHRVPLVDSQNASERDEQENNDNDNNNNDNDHDNISHSHVIHRLIKLSLLCALCWSVRGSYLMALRIWPSTDKTPFNTPSLAWEAIFYLLTEYPPSLGALILMISKPKTLRGANISMHNQRVN